MKSQQRHQLKQNDFAASVAWVSAVVSEYRGQVLAALVAIAVVGAASSGYFLWRKHTRDQAGALFAAAVAVNDAPIAPAPTVPGAKQATGTYPTVAARQEAAVQAFQQVAAAYPSSPDGLSARYQAAGGLFALGRLADAQHAYEDVIQRGDKSIYGTAARMGLAETLVGEGQYDQAIKTYTELAAERDGALPVDGVLVELARTYLKAGKNSEARAAFKRVVDEFPNSSYATEARTQVASIS